MAELEDHLSHLAVAKASLDDCVWVKRKALAVFEVSGGDRSLSDEDAVRSRNSLIGLEASKSILQCLDTMARAGLDAKAATATTQADLVDAVCTLLKTLRNLARDSSESQKMVRDLKAQEILKQCLENYDTNVPISRESLGVLTNLAAPSPNRPAIFDCCTRDVCRVLGKLGPQDLRLAQNGLACLVNLANDASLVDDICSVCLPALVEMGMIRCKDPLCAEYVETVFALLLRERSNSLKMLAEAQSNVVLELIINLITLHARNATICEHGLKCFQLFAQFQENKPLMLRCGVLNSLRLCVTNMTNNQVCAEWILRTIRNFAANNAEFKELLYDFGCSIWVLDLIRAHGTNSQVVKYGLSALWSLANLQKNKVPLVCDHQADIVIINALRLNPDSVSVAFTGLASLASLAYDSGTRKRMMKNGCVTAVLHAMKSHPSVAHLAENGCGCLWSLALDYECALQITSDPYAIKAILESLTKFPSQRKVVVKGLGALESLAISKTASHALVEHGAIPIVTSILKVHISSDIDVVIRSCNVLSGIAHFGEDFTTFQKFGVAEIAIDIQRLHPMDDKCNRAAERLLTSMEGSTLVPT